MKKYDMVEIFSPGLCRAGRGLAGISQNELAKRARVGPSTVADFERGARRPVYHNLSAIVSALEEYGVVFMAPDGKYGTGVRYRDPPSGAITGNG